MRPMTRERAEQGLRASQALIVGAKPGAKRHWIAMEARWKEHLRKLDEEGK